MLEPKELRKAIRHEGGVSRRLFLAYAAALAGVPLLSGPLDPDGGMPPAAVPVTWEVAEDEGMRTVVQTGKATATPLLGHTVHVEVAGLKPDRWYWYRFRAGDAQSPIGRTRTLPEAGATPERLRFAFASCQHYEAGLFTAYEAMAKDELDLVCHLGDYIYEGPGREGAVRKHAGPKLTALTDYRVRYSQYRSDPLLRAMHQQCPWLVTWDDHEVENNYAADISQRKGADPAEFLLHRAAAYQAYYEMMPLRRRSIPRGPDLQLYRKASFGQLAEFLILDTRQYRTDQPNGDARSDLNAAAMNPSNTLLGARQREWLQGALTASPATWNVLAQQVMMALVDRAPGDAHGFSMDQWPSAAHERIELVRFMQERRVKNPVVLTGDIHSNWVNDLRVDDRKADTPVVATEFVGTSISSGGNGVDKPNDLEPMLAENPCVRFHNRQRGYVRCTVTPGAWRSDYVVVADVTKPGGAVSTRASFVVEAGHPGAKPA
ncbi:MAG: phosphodiesterase/alkaline phosphatase [Armatimonadetes bacterium]|nr:phosphodiesterase/alkaline phosphatase [Armatimonadota bacterium]